MRIEANIKNGSSLRGRGVTRFRDARCRSVCERNHSGLALWHERRQKLQVLRRRVEGLLGCECVGRADSKNLLTRVKALDSSEERLCALEKMRLSLLGIRQGKHHEVDAAQAMVHLVTDLRPTDIEALRQSAAVTKNSNHNQNDERALKQAVTRASDPRTRVAAGKALLDLYGRAGLDEESWGALRNLALTSGDADLQVRVLTKQGT